MVYINHKSGIMITRKQLEILDIFLKNIFREMTFNEIKKETKERSNNKLQKAIENFKRENILNHKTIGKTILYSLNLKNNKTLDYLHLLSLNKKMPFDMLYKIQNSLLRNTEFFSLVIFGSYAKGVNTTKSDLDIAVFTENKKSIEPLLESIKRKELINIDYHIITRHEFLEMLKAEEENLGKQIFRHHLAFYNPYIFYSLLIKGWENGFRI